MLEYRSNRAGKYLQISVIIDGSRSFVILPAGWNEWGWFKMIGFIAEIVGRTPSDPSVQPRTSPSQPSSSLVDAPAWVLSQVRIQGITSFIYSVIC